MVSSDTGMTWCMTGTTSVPLSLMTLAPPEPVRHEREVGGGAAVEAGEHDDHGDEDQAGPCRSPEITAAPGQTHLRDDGQKQPGADGHGARRAGTTGRESSENLHWSSGWTNGCWHGRERRCAARTSPASGGKRRRQTGSGYGATGGGLDGLNSLIGVTPALGGALPVTRQMGPHGTRLFPDRNRKQRRVRLWGCGLPRLGGTAGNLEEVAGLAADVGHAEVASMS